MPRGSAARLGESASAFNAPRQAAGSFTCKYFFLCNDSLYPKMKIAFVVDKLHVSAVDALRWMRSEKKNYRSAIFLTREPVVWMEPDGLDRQNVGSLSRVHGRIAVDEIRGMGQIMKGD